MVAQLQLAYVEHPGQVEIFRQSVAATNGAARKSDPETSKLAARKLAAGSICQAILDALGAAPLGMTTEEIAERLGRKLVSVSPRMRPLEQAGLVERRGTRPNAGGTRAAVWVRP